MLVQKTFVDGETFDDERRMVTLLTGRRNVFMQQASGGTARRDIQYTHEDEGYTLAFDYMRLDEDLYAIWNIVNERDDRFDLPELDRWNLYQFVTDLLDNSEAYETRHVLHEIRGYLMGAEI